MKLAAVDIGSNAIRLLLVTTRETDEGVVFKKTALYRYPLRLGADVFGTGSISPDVYRTLKHLLRGFDHLVKAFDPKAFRVCATSAIREAKNKKEIIEKLAEKTGIQIELIDGEEEAAIIFSNQLSHVLRPNEVAMYVDVGGGSTELTIMKDGESVIARSFKIGTVRALQNNVKKEEWGNLEQWVKEVSEKYKPTYVIGSGGNINKLSRLDFFPKKAEGSIERVEIQQLRDLINKYSYEDRIDVLGLKPDRADVIIPAADIFLLAMNTAGIDTAITPKVGLADGIIRDLYKRVRC